VTPAIVNTELSVRWRHPAHKFSKVVKLWGYVLLTPTGEPTRFRFEMVVCRGQEGEVHAERFFEFSEVLEFANSFWEYSEDLQRQLSEFRARLAMIQLAGVANP
jgi:hypothetical protein